MSLRNASIHLCEKSKDIANNTVALIFNRKDETMGYAYTTLLGDGNFFYTTEAQNGLYQNHAFTSPLEFRLEYTAPTPTGVAISPPTNGVDLPHTMFMGNSEGYWIHRLFLNGHLTKTVTMVNQQFSMPMQFDRVESLAMSFSPSTGEIECRRGGDCPSPAGFAAIMVGVLLVGGKRSRH
jgi:hypothetical protein